MQKTCVFIIGTNGVGKTTLAKRLINDFGGIAAYKDKITYCNDGEACFIGRYEGVKFGGVDGLSNTSQLASHVKTGLNTRDVVFCEGKYIKSFSINMTNAMFQAKRGVVVFLYAPVSVLNERLIERAGGGHDRTRLERPKSRSAYCEEMAGNRREVDAIRHKPNNNRTNRKQSKRNSIWRIIVHHDGRQR